MGKLCSSERGITRIAPFGTYVPLPARGSTSYSPTSAVDSMHRVQMRRTAPPALIFWLKDNLPTYPATSLLRLIAARNISHSILRLGPPRLSDRLCQNVRYMT
jgi:hypothetical protein